MTVTLTRAATDVSALTGTPVSRSDGRLRLLLPHAAAEILAAAPATLLSEALPLEGEIYRAGSRPGVGLIPLPHDFLCLKAFRLKGWDTEVTHLTGPDEGALFALRASPWPEMAGNPSAPRCYRVAFPGGEALEFHAASGDAREAVVETALYIPRPVIRDDDSIRIPESLYHDIIILTAQKMNLWKRPSSPET